MTSGETVPRTFEKRLVYARQLRGLSARELSRRAGLNPGHVSVLESRVNKRIWPETVAKLARALDTRAEWLLFGSGEPPRPVAPTRVKRAPKAPTKARRS